MSRLTIAQLPTKGLSLFFLVSLYVFGCLLQSVHIGSKSMIGCHVHGRHCHAILQHQLKRGLHLVVVLIHLALVCLPPQEGSQADSTTGYWSCLAADLHGWQAVPDAQ